VLVNLNQKKSKIAYYLLEWMLMQWLKTSLPLFLSLCIGFLGVMVLKVLHAPMPWLIGSLLAIIVASRFPALPLSSPKRFSAPARAILGLVIGSAFKPEILHYLVDFLSSLLLIFPFVIITTLGGMWYYMKIVKFDLHTAYFSAVPGGLLEMATLAESFKLDLYKVVITQSSRLLFMVLLFPFIIEHFLHTSLRDRHMVTNAFVQSNGWELVGMLVLAFVGWKGAVKLKIPGGTLIGPMVLGAFAYGLGLIHSRPPTEVINLIQLILGTTVGFIFVGVTCKEMFKVLVQTLGYFMILVVISAGFIAVVHGMTDFPLLSILLAFAPGGQAEMNLIAIVVGANLPYVALHHIVRLFLVMGIAPILIRFVKKS